MQTTSIYPVSILFWTFSSISIILCLASLFYYTCLKSIKKFPIQACLFISGILLQTTGMIIYNNTFDSLLESEPIIPWYLFYPFDLFEFASYLFGGQIIICAISIFNVHSFGRKLITNPRRQIMMFYVASIVYFIAMLVAACLKRFNDRAVLFALFPSSVLFALALTYMICTLLLVATR